MAKEIVVWCECDLERDERVPAREYKVIIDGEERTVDLCPRHYAELLEPVVKMLAEYGQPVKRAYTKRAKAGAKPNGSKKAAQSESPTSINDKGEFICEYPGCGRPFTRPQGLGRHLLSHQKEESFSN